MTDDIPQSHPRFEEYQPLGRIVGAGDDKGSTNVPMDSWIYPALERLAALGFVSSQSISIRPWSRQECRRQLIGAEERLASDDVSATLAEEAERLISDLHDELADSPDGKSLVLESGYTRYGVIGGPALTDSFHFGQTWWNDFGRPLGRGSSIIAGFSLRVANGRLFLYDRQELQQTPGPLGLTTSQGQLIGRLDAYSTLPFTFPFASTAAAYTRQRPLELYAGFSFTGNSLSFGKQEIYWGPTTIGPLSFSSNAEPTYNLRLVASRPHPFPFAPKFGSYRFDLVFGKLSGHKYPARPYYNGGKIDFTFGKYLEVSFTRWSVLWGVGHPMTLASLRRNVFSADSTGSFAYGDRTDPGDRKSAFDFRLHIPGIGNSITIYADSYADDELNPLANVGRVVWSPGIYFARLPYLPHVDLRVEMASSEELSKDEGGQRFFINSVYRDPNLNKGFLLGSAVGRDGRAIEARSGYWITGRSRVELGFRQNKSSISYLPGGGTTSDAFLIASYAIKRRWTAEFFAQYERFLVPSFMVGPQSNRSGWLKITWNPKLHLVR